MENIYNPPLPEKKEPLKTARITVHKDHASKMSVGKNASMSMSGKVQSISPSVHDDHYDVELEDPKVDYEPFEDGWDDENAATMPKEKLKARIMKED